MKINRDVFAQESLENQMLIIYDTMQEINDKIKKNNYIKNIFVMVGGMIGGALTIICQWAFWKQ